MKLKTKFQDEDFGLGEVVEANIYYGGSGRIKVVVESIKGGAITFYFESLKGLNEMFEDYEKPKGIIDICPNTGLSGFWRVQIDYADKEEAEKAVEKLKAWERLKDKGLEVTEWGHGLYLDKTIIGRFRYEFPVDNKEDIEKDLDLLFPGGKK